MPQALAGLSVSTPPARSRSGAGFLRVVSGTDLDEQDRLKNEAETAARKPPEVADLASFIRQQWMIFRNHRNTGENPLNQRLLRAQRMFEGKYDPEVLAQIKNFGGSEVYARIVAVKCRGATSLLRDVYLGPERSWDIQSQPDPPIPPDVQANIIQLISTEVNTLRMAGQPVIDDQVHMRYVGLLHAAQAAARRNADIQSSAASDKIDDMLVAGGFYQALAEFMVDLPIFPYATLKGPTVRMAPKLVWTRGRASVQNRPQMFWERVNPFNIYWTPGASRIEDAAVIERKRYTRADLNDLIGLPGYDEAAVRAALEDYARGLRDWLDAPDTEQAINEGRENPTMNLSQYIDGLEFHGNVQGHMLLDNGVDPKLIPDPDRDYAVQSWVVGRWTLKTQINPNPRKRHPYYVTSYEKVPGTIAGHAIPDIIDDIQQVGNATLRSLVNNMSISSGPQVVINDEMLNATSNGDELYPWKRWHTNGDPMGNQRDPISFFQPASNAQELLTVYQQMTNVADEISGIPRYITGSERLGGAGRTASGLSMLMGNASKMLQTVAGNIDMDVMDPMLNGVYDMIMLTDTSGILTGEEQIRVRGVNVAVQKETERQKKLQFLQITANPIDTQIIGMVGRARLLRSIASDLGTPDDVVPDDQTLQEREKAQQQMDMMGKALMAHGQQPPGEGGPEQQPGQTAEPGPSDQPSGPVRPKGPHTGPTPLRSAAQAQGSQGRQATPAQLSDHAPPFNAFQQGISTHV